MSAETSPPIPSESAVADRLAIHDCLVRYCRGIDRADEDLIRACYWEDSFDDHGSWQGNGAEFAAYVVPRLRAGFTATHHLLLNSIVELDGAVAFAESYVHAHHVRPPDADGVISQFLFAGRYVDRLERRSGEWRIAHRVVVRDFTRVDPIVDDVDDAWKARFTPGQRDRSDASYRR